MKATFPNWIKSTIHSNIINAPFVRTLGKILGITPLLSGLSWAQTKERGASHVYKRAGFHPSEIFETIISSDYGVGPSLTQGQVYLRGVEAANSFDCQSVVFDQLTEGGDTPIPVHAYWSRASPFYKGLHDGSNCGGSGNNFFGSYVEELNTITGTKKFNIAGSGHISNPIHPYFIDGLSSESNARKGWDVHGQVQKSEDFGFFRSQLTYPAMSSFMGLATFAYNGLNEPNEELFAYSVFYEIQRKYAAGVSKTAIFHWISSEGVALAADLPWRNTGWIIKRDDVSAGSYWEAKSHHTSPVHNTLFLAFIGFLLTEGIVNWDSNREYYTNNPADMQDSSFLTSNNRLKWVSPLNTPAPPFNTGSLRYPHWPISPQDLYFVALGWYSEFKKRLDLGIELEYLMYTANGVTVPVDTSLTSDKRIFTKSAKPFGQHNILHLGQNRRPLCIGGKNGNNYVVMYFDPFGDPRSESDLIVHFGGGLGDVNVGKVNPRELGVFYSAINQSETDVNFIANGTGNSFDPNAPFGISPNKLNQFNRMGQNGVDAMQHHIMLGSDYSPSAGVYRDTELSTSINSLSGISRSGMIELVLVPVFGIGDSRFSESDSQVDAGGHKPDCTFAINFVPSMYSPTGIDVLEQIYEHLFEYLSINHPNQIRAIYKASGNSGEDYMPYASNYDGGPGCGDFGFGGIGDYSPHALTAWRDRMMENFGANVPFSIGGNNYASSNAPIPYISPDNQNNRYVDFSRREIREVIRFWNQGVADSHKRMRDKVKAYMPNVMVGSFFADFFNQQAIQWTMNAGSMKKQFDESDVVYHSDNANSSNWGRCLIGTDVIKGGTFGPNKLSAIEFDPFDVDNPNGGPINKAHLKAAVIKFIEHGGNDIHFAMNWSDNQIDELGEVMAEIRAEKTENSSWVPLYATQRAIAPIVEVSTGNMFASTNFLDTAWQSTGNSLGNPFAAHIINVRVNDTFWDE